MALTYVDMSSVIEVQVMCWLKTSRQERFPWRDFKTSFFPRSVWRVMEVGSGYRVEVPPTLGTQQAAVDGRVPCRVNMDQARINPLTFNHHISHRPSITRQHIKVRLNSNNRWDWKKPQWSETLLNICSRITTDLIIWAQQATLTVKLHYLQGFTTTHLHSIITIINWLDSADRLRSN